MVSSLGKAAGLFVVTAIAEIVGCYLPYWRRSSDSAAYAVLGISGASA